MVKNLVSKSEFARLAGVSPAAVTKACKSSLAKACSGKRIDANHVDAITYAQKQDRGKTPPAATGLDPFYEQAVEFCRNSKRPTPNGIRTALKIGSERAARLFETIKATGVLNLPDPGEPPPMPAVKTPRTISGHTAKANSKKAEALDDLAEGKALHKVPENIEAFADMTLRELIQRFGTDVAFCDWLKATKSIEDINEKRIKAAQLRGELISRELVKIGIIDPIDSAHKKLLTDVKKTVATRASAMVSAGKSQEEIEAFVADQITSILRPTKTKIARTLRNA